MQFFTMLLYLISKPVTFSLNICYSCLYTLICEYFDILKHAVIYPKLAYLLIN